MKDTEYSEPARRSVVLEVVDRTSNSRLYVSPIQKTIGKSNHTGGNYPKICYSNMSTIKQ